MRRFLPYPLPFLVSSFFLVLFCSCSDSKEIDDTPSNAPNLSIIHAPPAFGSGGGSDRLTFATNEAWQLTTQLPEGDPGGWFEITPQSGNAGERIAVTVTLDPNKEYVSRSFGIVVQAATLRERIEITQLKKNVILLGDNLLEIDSGEQTLDIAVQSNVEYTVTLKQDGAWIGEIPESRAAAGLEERIHRFKITANEDARVRTGIIVFTDQDSDLSDELTVVQAAWVDSDPERTALKALYDAGGGGGWTRNDNWCSDKPLAEWYGVETDAEGRVTALRLPQNNLTGAILKYVGKLTSLRHLDLSRNELEEELEFWREDTRKWCSHLDDLLELETIDMNHNRLTSGPPGNWSRMEKLRYIDLSSNRLTGTCIPAQWQPLYQNGNYIDVILNDNYLGSVNDFLEKHPQWSRIALQFIRQKFFAEGGEGWGGLNYDDVYLPDFTFTDLRDGTQGSIREVYAANKLTMLLQWDPTIEESNRFMETIARRFHTLYGPQGFAMVAITPEGDAYREAAQQYLATHHVAWPVVTDYADAYGKRLILPTEPYPSCLFVDQHGEVVEDMYTGKRISDPFWVSGDPPTTADLVARPFEIVDMLNKRMNQTFEYSEYRSTDFSMDKQYETLQTATRGKGIDIVLMGEAFTDIDIETGFYRMVMEFAMESFFALEPTKSYRDYFNVHMVYAVSRDAYIRNEGGGSTALQITYNNIPGNRLETYLAVNKNLPNYYRLPVQYGVTPPTVGVIINNNHDGEAYMQSYAMGPNHAFTGYPYDNRQFFRGTFIHETTGHSFGLLGDEYESNAGNPITGEITEPKKRELTRSHNKGWYLNLSLSNDPMQVPWSHLIGHSRYPYVGAHQGGYYFNSGVWRSENTSVMRDHRSVSYFNAVSRELIVKRIMALSGEEYTFEKFLSKDCDDGRPGVRSTTSWQTTRQDDYIHQPPIMGE